MKNIFLTAILATTVFILPAGSAQAKDYTIKMISDDGNYRFEPREITIKSGDQVTWINMQDTPHDVMTENIPDGAEEFMSPMLEKKGQQWSHIFTVSGTYGYHCHPHAALGMQGAIIVDKPSSEHEHTHTTEHHHDMVEPAAIEKPPAEKTAPEQSKRKVLYWYDPMMPDKKFDKAGKSPFMDMELVPKYADEQSSVEAVKDGEKPVVVFSAATVQKMGVRTEIVAKAAAPQAIRAAGIVMPNERSLTDIVSQVEGRIDSLQQSANGDTLHKGALFYTLVSPELGSLQSDYIIALEGGLKDMAAAARKRMQLLGIDGETLNAITKSRKAFERVPFHAPAEGIITELLVRNGAYIKAGDTIAHIQDLSTVWVEAAVPEKDAAAIKTGDSAKIVFSTIPHPYDAAVDYIYPSVNAETRTVKIRLIINNKDGLLKPAAFAAVEFSAFAADRLTVPSQAILQSSNGNHVIVKVGNGKFQPKTVETGFIGAGRTEIISGLQEGDEVVTSSQFMIDSESSLNESLEKFDSNAKENSHGK